LTPPDSQKGKDHASAETPIRAGATVPVGHHDPRGGSPCPGELASGDGGEAGGWHRPCSL